MSIGRLLLAALVLASMSSPASARDQWSTNHGANNPPVDPRWAPGGAFSGYVQKVTGNDFWKGQLANTIPAGTVFTAILEDDLSSSKNKQGDTFALTLDDGFVMNGNVLVPPKSKILGTVTSATPAKMQRKMGVPGNLEISLQTLILPDGSHYAFAGFIDGNPNAKAKRPAKVRHAGVAISDFGESVAGMAMSFVSGPGFMMKKINRGLDFKLDAGDALPIRLTRGLELNPQPHPQSQLAATPYAAVQQASPVAGINPHGPVQVPGFVPMGTNGAPNMVPTYSGNQMPPLAPVTTGGDPNLIFNQPLGGPSSSSLNQIPDPF